MTHRAVFVCVFCQLSVTTFAEGIHYQFNKIAQLNNAQGEDSQWVQLVVLPNKIQQYFVINETGQMYFVDNIQKQHPVLDLSTNRSKKSSPIKFSAIELHPNFALRGQLGHRIFYTAHLEVLDEQSRTKRIQERGEELALKFDAVITEWKFNSDDYKKVGLSTKREVLRIAVPDNTMTIKQMSFSPYTKSWNDGFGLLYVALNGEEKWQKPLYSGVILRINPAKFGLRSFTVPNNNPYIKENNIKDELYLLGGQNIKQFIWPNKNSDDILLSHQYDGKSLLSSTNGQNDWRNDPPKQIIYQGVKSIEHTLLYQGSNLPYLRNKLFLLMRENQQWSLESLNVTSSVHVNSSVENKPQQEWQFTSQQIASNSEVSFINNRDGEVLIFDKMAGNIFQIFQDSLSIAAPVEEQVIKPKIEAEPANRFIMLFIVMIVAAVGFYFFKRNQFSAKSVVRKQFAHIELSESKLQIGLYHRHQKTTNTIINITDIASCEVKLNNLTINIINQKAGHGFNNEKEQDLRNILTKEQVDKMIDGKVRQVNLLITDIEEKKYAVCLYMRKGSDRVTKKTYLAVIDDLIDWCWLIATKINANETKKRNKKPVTSTESKIESVEQKHKQNLLYNQPAAVRTTTHESIEAHQNVEVDLPQEQLVTMDADENLEVVNKHNTIDTGLVNALEKLVDLKQQGFLTQEEFTKAKENLMQSLFEKPKK